MERREESRDLIIMSSCRPRTTASRAGVGWRHAAALAGASMRGVLTAHGSINPQMKMRERETTSRPSERETS